MTNQMHNDLLKRHHTTALSSDAHSSSDSSTLYAPQPDSSKTHHIGQGGSDVQRRFSLRPRFSSTWRQKSDNDERGPLGLQLLFSSPEPLIDLIFVHGLRGGSTKTWRRGTDPELFWPQNWLPGEPEFSNASIHSFGYESDWGSTKPSILNVHDFGRALYEEMRSSPFLRQKARTPIVLVGHSMGGLVIKKAYILAHQDSRHRDISERIRCIFFLATPHRGSDYASILNGILKVSGLTGITSSREYINDLTTGSTSTQLINEAFGKYANKLLIYSFYETLPTTLGLHSTMIVEKHSAILGMGYENERVYYLNASHREVCKFDSRQDSNYISLKNALATAVHDLLRDVVESNEQNSQTQLRIIRSFLGISGLSDEFHEKLRGSCQWIEDREDFKKWRDPSINLDQDYHHNPSIYWVNASPGAGKTVLAAHMVSHLQELRLQHASYYFHFGKKSSQSLAACLRSVAYEMASSHAAVRDTLMRLHNDGSTFDQDDAQAIWLKIFKAGIFQVPMFTPQYWVIDALDECVKYAEFFTLLKGVQSRFPLQIFITSRKLSDMQKLIRQLEGCATSIVEIPIFETMKDIELFVRNRIEILPIDSDEEKEALAKGILVKSNASFLWIRLVMDELEGVYGYESILEVLHGIPEGMISYYARIVAEMVKNNREKHIAKAILSWVVLAARPLTIFELSEALKLDINVHLPSAKTAIEGLCGQLVYVDKQTNLVHIVHSTAGEFLLSDDAEEFIIQKSKSHERVALTCLRLLLSPEMQPPRHRRLLSQKRAGGPPSMLLDYAVMYFSDHVLGASAESDELLVALDRFLATTVLKWIEKVVAKKDLYLLIRTAKNLKAYLDRRSKYRSPLNRHVNRVDSWTTDLSRLTTKFGGALMSFPQSIYFLIPPLCPKETAIYKQFGKSIDGLTLLGTQSTHWDDCIASINFEDEIAVAVNCGNSLIAVGFESGNIHLYNHRSCQKETEIIHNFPIDLVQFDPLGSFIASCSTKFLSVWDLEGNLLWKARLRSRCILLTCSPTFIMGITMQGKALCWDIATGELLEEHSYPYQPPDYEDELQRGVMKAPFAASVSPGLELLALAYRNGPICIFELQTSGFLGWAIDDHLRAPGQLIFNPNPEVNLLLVAYNESHLALYDSWSGSLVQCHEAEKPVIFTSVACSPDGRTFGTVDVLGNLRIWDFESLTVLYRVLTPSLSFRVLEFTSDSFNLVDIVNHELRIWSPSVLVRKTIEEEASMSDQAATQEVTEGQFETFQSSKINSTAAHKLFPVIFAGNHSGDVSAYNSRDGQLTGVLYSHHNAVVRDLAVSRSDLIASSDLNATVQVRQIDALPTTMIKADNLKFQARFRAAICQILFDHSGEYLLISTSESDHVYSTTNGTLVGSIPFDANERSLWRWIVMPGAKYDKQFALFSDHKLVIYSAEYFPKKIDIGQILNYEVDEGFVETGIEAALFHPETMSFILEIRQRRDFVSSSLVFVFKLPSTFAPGVAVTLKPVGTLLSTLLLHFLGISESGKRLVFLHQNSWVCSIDIDSPGDQQYTQHFFVPNGFISNHDVPPIQTANDEFVFCLHDKLLILKNGLQFQETRTLE